jgi:hypothetical protein
VKLTIFHAKEPRPCGAIGKEIMAASAIWKPATKSSLLTTFEFNESSKLEQLRVSDDDAIVCLAIVMAHPGLETEYANDVREFCHDLVAPWFSHAIMIGLRTTSVGFSSETTR